MLKDFRAAFLGSLALLGLLLLPAASYAQSGIQMLPPLPADGVPCAANGTSKVLTWDGSNPLYCISKFTVDHASGIITSGDPLAGGGGLVVGPNQFFGSLNSTTFGLSDNVGSLTLTRGDVTATGTLKARDVSAITYAIPGVTNAKGELEPLDSGGLTTVNKLKNLPGCSTGKVLTKLENGNFDCVDGGGSGSEGDCFPTGGHEFHGDICPDDFHVVALGQLGPGTAYACCRNPGTGGITNVPTCTGAGSALQFDGTAFQCATATTPVGQWVGINPADSRTPEAQAFALGYRAIPSPEGLKYHGSNQISCASPPYDYVCGASPTNGNYYSNNKFISNLVSPPAWAGTTTVNQFSGGNLYFVIDNVYAVPQ